MISFPLQGDEIQMFIVSAAWVKEGTPAPSRMWVRLTRSKKSNNQLLLKQAWLPKQAGR